jgi:hypothetical protein
LPVMGWRLGMNQDYMKMFSGFDTDERELLLINKIYPDYPQLADEDWKKIVDYYIENAPEKPLLQDKKPLVTFDLGNFSVKKIYGNPKIPPAVTLVKFDTLNLS